MNDGAPTRPDTRAVRAEVDGWRSLAALYERVAETLERSAVLAEHHGDRLRSKGEEQTAGREFERAVSARAAAGRGRTLASRLRGSHEADVPAE